MFEQYDCMFEQYDIMFGQYDFMFENYDFMFAQYDFSVWTGCLQAMITDVVEMLLKKRQLVLAKYGPGLLGLNDDLSNIDEIADKMGWTDDQWIVKPTPKRQAVPPVVLGLGQVRRPMLPLGDAPPRLAILAPAAPQARVVAPPPEQAPLVRQQVSSGRRQTPPPAHMQIVLDSGTNKHMLLNREDAIYAWCGEQPGETVMWGNNVDGEICLAFDNGGASPILVRLDRFTCASCSNPLNTSVTNVLIEINFIVTLIAIILHQHKQ